MSTIAIGVVGKGERIPEKNQISKDDRDDLSIIKTRVQSSNLIGGDDRP